VDRGDEGRVVFGALRALRGDYFERALGVDAAVNRLVTATVLEEMPGLMYRVALERRQTVLAHAAGNLQRNFVRLLPGDRVEVELSPLDPTRGRVVRKLVDSK
jgi:translation initiation factor IF-1